ncbi:hypothetical protein RSAG8_00117, partial [Rhizoctonia solani AG-8 WAC10335]
MIPIILAYISEMPLAFDFERATVAKQPIGPYQPNLAQKPQY